MDKEREKIRKQLEREDKKETKKALREGKKKGKQDTKQSTLEQYMVPKNDAASANVNSEEELKDMEDELGLLEDKAANGTEDAEESAHDSNVD